MKSGQEMLTKDYSTMIKGIAVLMMIVHHLWGFPSRVPGLHILSIEEQFGIASKICVSIFMFLSGYGLYYTFKKKGSIQLVKRVRNVYERFWQVFVIFVPIGFLIVDRSFHVQEFLLNLFCLDYSYNMEWWFMGTYLELIIVMPLVLRIDKKRYFPLVIVLAAILLCCVSNLFAFNSGGVKSHVYCFGHYFPVFYLGLFFCKYHLYERYNHVIRNWLLGVGLCIFLTGVAYFIRSKWDVTEMTILMTPMLIYLFLCLFEILGRINKVFMLFGKHSMNMWLMHTFFCYYYFQKEMLMVSKNPIVAFLLIVLLSLLSSMIIDWFWKKIKCIKSHVTKTAQ